MSHKEKDHDKNNFNKNEDVETQNERRIDQLINLVEKHTRSERHLEQHSDIASPENIEHSEDVQRQREEEINNLKNVIVHGKNVNVDEVSDLQRNLEFTEGYLENNADSMDKETLRRTKEKQAHREEQIDNLLR
jgi:hypothetical protein